MPAVLESVSRPSPAGKAVAILAQVLQDWFVFLGEDPDAYVGMAARESQLWQDVFLLLQSLRGRAVVDYKKCWLALKQQVEGPQVIVKALTGV